MAGRGVSAFVRSFILAQAFSYPIGRRAALPLTASDPGKSQLCHSFSLSPRRPGPMRRAVALVTAAAFVVLPPLQSVPVAVAQDGLHLGVGQKVAQGARRQLANVDPSLIPLPTRLAAPHTETVKAGTAARIAHDGAVLEIPAGAVTADTTLSITPLGLDDLAAPDPGLAIATLGPRAGYRMGPPGQRFARPITVTLPYDPARLPKGHTDATVGIFWYDAKAKRWVALEKVGVDPAAQTITARTDHFTDFIAGTVTVPDHPQVASFNPNQIADLKAADPGAKINLIEPPQANASGDARVSYPIEVPTGRNGIQPQLALNYDSSRGNGWLGVGWDLSLPSIEIDTRWGVPRYDTGQIDPKQGALETETYLLNGEQLAPVAHRGDLKPRTGPKKSFSLRVEGQFLQILRHGNSPKTYFWECTDKEGTRFFYGGSSEGGLDPQAVLSDPTSGNIGRWLLREMVDRDGNTMRYSYDVVADTLNGPEPARQIYPRSVRYTGRPGGQDGPYEVSFIRTKGRPDPIVDARLGFKTVTTDRLTSIEVKLLTESNPLIRRYQLDYQTGQFAKSLVSKITQFGEDGSEFHAHELTYFDEVGTPTTDLNGFAPSVAVPGGGVTEGSGLVSGVDGTAFSGEANATNQVHLYTGVGIGPRKELSIGFKGGSEGGKASLSQILIDINGDGRPDQVFEEGGTVMWRANAGNPETPEFGPARPVAGLGVINRSSTQTFTAGAQAYIGAAAGIKDFSRSRTSESVYFTDVNGDGLPDLVSGGNVLFNRLNAAGEPSFAADSPTPLGSGAPSNTAGLITVTPEERAEAAAAFHLVDPIRRWIAPFTGRIAITGQVALTQAGDAAADGVRAAIQLKGTEIFSVTIADPTDLTPKPITGLSDIAVTAGDPLYFRVNSRNDGAFDTVAFDPTITYTQVDGVPFNPSALDENGLTVFATTASADFAFGGRPLPVSVPATGTATLSGTLVKPIATSDEVRFVVTHRSAATGLVKVVFQRAFAPGATGNEPFSVPLTLTEGDEVLARIDADTRINLAGLRFASTLTYETVNGAPAPMKPDGTRLLKIDLPTTAQVYPVSAVSPFAPWVSTVDGTVHITQVVTSPGPGFTGRITLAARSGGVMLAKQTINIDNGVFKDGIDRLSADLTVTTDQVVFFTAEATNPATPVSAIGAPTTGSGEQLPYDVRLEAPVTEPFGGGYRNWWFGDLNGTNADAPIDQSVLRFPVDENDQVFRQFLGMLPFQTEERWRARDTNAFVSGAIMGSTRLGTRILEFSDGTGFGGARGVTKTLSGRNAAGNISILVFGEGESRGTGATDIDFLDFNGDGYPDVVGAGSVQATLPNGALEGRRIGVGVFPKVRQAEIVSNNRNLGATTSSLRSTAELFNLNILAEMGPFNVGIGISSSDGTTKAEWDLLDINGDGLPDFVQPSGSGLKVQLNLGYRFGQPEDWGGTGTLRFERTEASGTDGSAGFNLPAYSFGGGIASTRNRAATERDLMDVNGDGLPDLVLKSLTKDTDLSTPGDTVVKVQFNTGAGFLPEQDYTGALPRPIQSRRGVHRNLGLYFTVAVGPFSIFGVGASFIINPGFHDGDSFGGSETQLRDFDGDGYADHIAANGAAVNVSLNRHGRTNLLKDIRRPLGATIALDYVRAGNTPEHPQRRWVLASRTVFDGLENDSDVAGPGEPKGTDFQIATFTYEDGSWDRAERTFYGFRTVREQHRDTADVTKANLGEKAPTSLRIERSIVQTFRNDSFYTKMLMERQVTEDGAGAPFLETVQTYNVVNGVRPNEADPAVPGLEDFTAIRFPQLTRRDRRFFEGQPAPGKQTAETFAYDGFGNTTVYTDLGDNGPEDDTIATVRYTASDPACQTTYIVGIPDRIRVTDAVGTELRRRESDIDCATANPTQVRRFLADGSAAVTDLSHDDHGRLTRVVGPANAAGERTRLDYVYDATVGVHVISVTDHFGHNSTATYNFKFAEVATSTDRNGQTVTNTYDRFGRLTTVVGPYEQGTGRITIAFQYNPHADVPWALTRHIDVFRSLSDPIETALFTDGLKRVVQTKKDGTVADEAGDTPVDKMVVSGRVVFDSFGRTIRQFYPVTEALGQAGKLNETFDGVQPTRSTFDVLDRVTSIQIPDNTTTTTSYDFAPDRAGRIQFRTTVVDANNVRKEMFRDVRALITTVNEFNNGGAQVLRTSYAYDPLKQITTVTDNANNLTRVAYDTFGRRTAIDSPDSGRTAFTYDLADNLTAKETANLRATGQRISYAYEFTRLKAISYPVFPENNVTYTYGPASLKGQPGNRVGRITKITDAAGTEEQLYGPLGETVEEKRTIPAPGNQLKTYVTKYQFDTFNRLQVLTYPDNDTVVTYNYDSGGLVRRVSGVDTFSSDVYAPRVDYDKFGQRLLVDFGNGARTTYAYDDKTRRITSVKASLPNGYTFHDLAFSYDKVGNLTKLKNNAIPPGDFPGPGLGNAIGGPWTKDYAYDQLYRMTTSAGQHQTNPNEVSTYSYDQTYDAIHNITRKNQRHEFKSSVQPDTTYDYTFTYPPSGSVRPHGAVAIGPYDILHDANGNLTRQTLVGTSDIVHYVYDEENRLACVHKGQQVPNPSCNEQGISPLEFIYDHSGIRKRKDASSPTFYPNQFLTDIGGGAGGQFKHIFLGATRILTMKVIPPPDKQQWYYHPDHLGSTSIVTNEKGQLAEHTHYFPYGEIWLQERPSTPVPYLFSSKEFDPETGLYDFGARYLNPRFAQWMTTDPALGDYVGGSNGGVHMPPNLALYAYSWNSPATLTDPDGRQVGLPPCIGHADCAKINLEAARNLSQGATEIVTAPLSLFNRYDTKMGPPIYINPVTKKFYNQRDMEDAVVGTLAGFVAPPARAASAAGSRVAQAGRHAGQWVSAQFGRLTGQVSRLVRGGCSFSEGTPVVTAEGLKPIGKVKAGDRVLARSEASGAYGFKPVKQVFKHHDRVKLHLTLEDPAAGTTEVIETTPGHPFHVPGRGFVQAADLRPGDPISGASSVKSVPTLSLIADQHDTSGALRVKDLVVEDESFWAYNLEVADHHTYFVGQTQAWVHNACAEVRGGVLYLRNKFAAGSVEDLALQQHVTAWNQEIQRQGGSMTRQRVTPAMRAQADEAADLARTQNPHLYPSGMSPGHTPDVGWGGSVTGPINPLNSTVNSYVGGATQAVTPGSTYGRVLLYR
jgi:RHS repeat-associated protein